ncbi:MAG: hypothetical protein KDB24_10030 [Microthrixaceae bacterium]|nr:hypothetical protein [Microthrixaceae bacterium]
MPWCNDCNRFYTQSTLNPDGTCPDGHQAAPLPPPGAAAIDPASGPATDSATTDEDSGRVAPWHFWVMVVALAIYLGWRLVQGIMWAIGKL